MSEEKPPEEPDVATVATELVTQHLDDTSAKWDDWLASRKAIAKKNEVARMQKYDWLTKVDDAELRAKEELRQQLSEYGVTDETFQKAYDSGP